MPQSSNVQLSGWASLFNPCLSGWVAPVCTQVVIAVTLTYSKPAGDLNSIPRSQVKVTVDSQAETESGEGGGVGLWRVNPHAYPLGLGPPSCAHQWLVLVGAVGGIWCGDYWGKRGFVLKSQHLCNLLEPPHRPPVQHAHTQEAHRPLLRLTSGWSPCLGMCAFLCMMCACLSAPCNLSPLICLSEAQRSDTFWQSSRCRTHRTLWTCSDDHVYSSLNPVQLWDEGSIRESRFCLCRKWSFYSSLQDTLPGF